MLDKVDVKEIWRLYNKEQMSSSEIAKKYKTYAKKIERMLKKAGYALRSRSEAQRLRLKSGKAEHPTEGKERSEATKDRIGAAVAETWKNLPDEVKEERREVARQIMENRPDREEFIQKGFQAMQETSQYGSKLEKIISDLLVENGYFTLNHQKHTIRSRNMHIDILLPDDMIAIEVDGPTHHDPIFGEEHLEMVRETDERKNRILKSAGYNVIRLLHPKKISRTFVRECSEKLLETLDKALNNKKPTVYRI